MQDACPTRLLILEKSLFYCGAQSEVFARFARIVAISRYCFGAVLGIGLALGFGNNVWLTSAQNLVPTTMRGRYFAIDGLLSFVGGPPSIAVGGILITIIGVSRVFELSGVLLLVSVLLFALMKSLWMLDGQLAGDQNNGERKN